MVRANSNTRLGALPIRVGRRSGLILTKASPDITGDVLDLDMIESNSFDAIFSSHNIEHVYAYQVPLMLKGFLRVLNPNGYFVVTCPNLQAVAKLVARDQLTDVAYVSPAGPITPQDVIFGHSASLEKEMSTWLIRLGLHPRLSDLH